MREGFRATGLKLRDLSRLKGIDTRRVAIARVYLAECVGADGLNSGKLVMKSASKVSQQLRRWAMQSRTRAPSKALARWAKQ